MKVEQFNNKNQFIIVTNGKKVFQSYDSTICIIDYSNKTITLGHDWDYSKTTSKHLYLFLDMYATDNNLVDELRNSKNKRKVINKYIDDELINYDENLK